MRTPHREASALSKAHFPPSRGIHAGDLALDESLPQQPAGPLQVESFLRLWEAHRRRVFHFILALLPAVQDAEDVLQETSIVLWRKFGEFEPGTNFLSWAHKVAHFEVLRHRRKGGRHQLIEESVL